MLVYKIAAVNLICIGSWSQIKLFLLTNFFFIFSIAPVFHMVMNAKCSLICLNYSGARYRNVRWTMRNREGNLEVCCDNVSTIVTLNCFVWTNILTASCKVQKIWKSNRLMITCCYVAHYTEKVCMLGEGVSLFWSSHSQRRWLLEIGISITCHHFFGQGPVCNMSL